MIRPTVGAEIDVGSRVSGIVRRIPVRVGDRVNLGQLLARLDPTEFEAQLNQARADRSLAEAQLALAVTSHERAVRLAGDGIVAPTDLDAAARDLEVATAQAELAAAAAQIHLLNKIKKAAGGQ